MTNKFHQIREKHEFGILQNHAETNLEANKKILVIAIGLTILSFCLLFVVWSYVFSLQNYFA